VTIKNSGDLPYNYSVEIAAVSADGTQRFGSTSVYASKLAAGQSTQDKASFYENIPQGAVFKVVKVGRNSY